MKKACVFFAGLAGWIHFLEGESLVLKPGAKFRCRAGHRQVVLAPVGHDGFWGWGCISHSLDPEACGG